MPESHAYLLSNARKLEMVKKFVDLTKLTIENIDRNSISDADVKQLLDIKRLLKKLDFELAVLLIP